MRVLILGGDGYLGWPTAMHLSAYGHHVSVMDNFWRRTVDHELGAGSLVPILGLKERISAWRALSSFDIDAYVGDVCDYRRMTEVLLDAKPDAIVHYAEQSSAPYSFLSARHSMFTQQNNVLGTLNLIWALRECFSGGGPHIIKLGTMGEYGTPNIAIEEGWINVEHEGRSARMLYPKMPGSWYHASKVHDSVNLEFASRCWGMRVTDLNQGIVYGTRTVEMRGRYEKNVDVLATRLDYDGLFGTVLNRFCVQAVLGMPLSVYGSGGQTRGFLHLQDTVNCVRLAVEHPAEPGEFRVFNQFTEQFSVRQLAEMVQRVFEAGTGRTCSIQNIPNPRKESEEHWYDAKHTGLMNLGLIPTLLTDSVLMGILADCEKHKESCDPRALQPGVSWSARGSDGSGFAAISEVGHHAAGNRNAALSLGPRWVAK